MSKGSIPPTNILRRGHPSNSIPPPAVSASVRPSVKTQTRVNPRSGSGLRADEKITSGFSPPSSFGQLDNGLLHHHTPRGRGKSIGVYFVFLSWMFLLFEKCRLNVNALVHNSVSFTPRNITLKYVSPPSLGTTLV